MEALKNQIEDAQKKQIDCIQSTEQSKIVCEHIRATIIELILRLQDIDEVMETPPMIIVTAANFTKEIFSANDLTENQTNESLLQILEDKIKRALIISGQVASDIVAFDDEDLDALVKVNYYYSMLIINLLIEKCVFFLG